MSKSRVVKLYETFHQFRPRELGYFHPDMRIPRRGKSLGEGATMFYRSDKRNPSTGEDEGMQDYYHPHERPRPTYYLPVDRGGEALRLGRVSGLARIGTFDGAELADGTRIEPEGRVVDWYWAPDARALLVVSDARRVDLVVRGGNLDVEWRGVVG